MAVPKWVKGSTIAFACLGLLAFGAHRLLYELHFGAYDDLAFNQRDWKEKIPNADDPSEFKALLRGKMVADLMRNHLKTGMSRSQVNALLGPPDTPKPLAWEYQLGVYSDFFFLIDGDLFTVAFDADGLLTECWVNQG